MMIGWILITNEISMKEIKRHIIIPLRAKRVGEFIEIKQNKYHPPVYWVPLGVCDSVTLTLCSMILT